MTQPTSWLGDTPEDRRTSLELVLVLLLVAPLIAAAELAAWLGVPCKMP